MTILMQSEDFDDESQTRRLQTHGLGNAAHRLFQNQLKQHRWDTDSFPNICKKDSILWNTLQHGPAVQRTRNWILTGGWGSNLFKRCAGGGGKGFVELWSMEINT